MCIEDLCNGSTPDSDSVCGGSNPSSSAKKKTTPKGCGFLFAVGWDSNNLNAARMSAAGEGLTEPLHYFIESLIQPMSRETGRGTTPKGCGFLFAVRWDSNNLNAARMSAAGEDLTEPLHYFIESLIQPMSRETGRGTTPKGCGFLFAIGWDSNNLNAARMSAAGEGLTEPLHDFIESLIRPVCAERKEEYAVPYPGISGDSGC